MQSATPYTPPHAATRRYERDIIHEDEDCRKIGHNAVHDQTGRTVYIDLSPYCEMSAEVFAALIEMGFPKRSSLSPWTPEEVEQALIKLSRKAA